MTTETKKRTRNTESVEELDKQIRSMEADYEASRERCEREREAGLAFTQKLREQLEARRIPVEVLMKSEESEDADDAA